MRNANSKLKALMKSLSLILIVIVRATKSEKALSPAHSGQYINLVVENRGGRCVCAFWRLASCASFLQEHKASERATYCCAGSMLQELSTQHT